MPKLLIIIGSTRPGRAGAAIGEWFAAHAAEQGAFDVEVADLHELALPMLDEATHPRLGQYEHDHTKDWAATVDGADALVFVTPEYNAGYPAPLKNAIDFLHAEWRHKPVGFVSYGGISAGTRAVQQLKQVVTTLSMMPLPEAVAIPFHAERFDEDGFFRPVEITEQAGTTMLQSLERWAAALRPLREEARAAA